MFQENEVMRTPHVELLNLVMDVALGEMLHVGELQVQLSQPHQHALSGALKLLPLAGKVLGDKWKHRGSRLVGDSLVDFLLLSSQTVLNKRSV